MRATLLALLNPRRLIPIVVVCAPLVAAQARFSRDPLGIPLAILMCGAFVAIAPVSYRVLFPEGLDLSHGAIRLVLYAAVGAGVVLSIGVAIPRLVGMGHTFLTDRNSLAVSIAMFLVGGWGLGRDIGFEARLQRMAKEAERAQLLALRAHLDPHFLFNTLNAIAEWCRADPLVAERATLDLAALLRAVFDAVHTPGWPLARELALLEQLAALYAARDAGRYRFRFDVERVATARDIPPLVLLPLFENAIKHGPAAGHPGEVVLQVRADHRDAVVTIENPGAFGGPRAGAQGLASVERRLALAYGEDTRAAFTAPAAATTRVTVRLPPQTLSPGAR